MLVSEPDPAYLSTEPGWYRYWLAPANNPACTLFYASAEAQANWLAVLSGSSLHTPPLLSDPSATCIAAKKIDKPKSRYIYQEFDDVEKRAFGLSVTRFDLIDQQTGKIRVHFQRTYYLGPWYYEALYYPIAPLVGGNSGVSCPVPDALYKAEGDTFPKSTVGPLSDEWPLSYAVDPAELP